MFVSSGFLGPNEIRGCADTERHESQSFYPTQTRKTLGAEPVEPNTTLRQQQTVDQQSQNKSAPDVQLAVSTAARNPGVSIAAPRNDKIRYCKRMDEPDSFRFKSTFLVLRPELRQLYFQSVKGYDTSKDETYISPYFRRGTMSR